MEVDDFKGIFWLEYLHRLLGRAIGIVFLVPFLVFLATRRIRPPEIPKYLSMFVLGGLQGVLGWYMVKSGLVDNPHVSQYRLTAHLVAAVAIFAFMFWVAMSLLFRSRDPARHALYPGALALTILVTVTLISGGFVAGLKAGSHYNTFPLMGGRWIPEGVLAMQPLWRNFFDNVATVQFDHRVLAITTFVAICALWFVARGAAVPERTRPALHLMLLIGAVQVALGISTLLLNVPISLAATHQAVAMLLFTIVLYLCHGLRGAHR